MEALLQRSLFLQMTQQTSKAERNQVAIGVFYLNVPIAPTLTLFPFPILRHQFKPLKSSGNNVFYHFDINKKFVLESIAWTRIAIHKYRMR